MKFVTAAFLALLLSGCSYSGQTVVPITTSYNLDGTSAGEPVVQRPRVRRSVRSANASMETTGSVEVVDREHELSKLKVNTPEWWELRKKLESERADTYSRERARLTICRNC